MSQWAQRQAAYDQIVSAFNAPLPDRGGDSELLADVLKVDGIASDNESEDAMAQRALERIRSRDKAAQLEKENTALGKALREFEKVDQENRARQQLERSLQAIEQEAHAYRSSGMSGATGDPPDIQSTPVSPPSASALPPTISNVPAQSRWVPDPGEYSQQAPSPAIGSFADGWNDSYWSVLQGQQPLAHQAGGAARRASDAIQSFGRGLISGMTGYGASIDSQRAFKQGQYGKAVIHGIQALLEAGSTVASASSYAVLKSSTLAAGTSASMRSVGNAGSAAPVAGAVDAAGETVTVFRVQGGTLPHASRQLITIDANGNPVISKTTLSVSVGDPVHAEYFLSKRPGAHVTSFDVPRWMGDFIDGQAIPQFGYRTNPANQGGLAPKLVDPTTPGRSYELPDVWAKWLEEVAVPGSGRVKRGGTP